MTPFALTLVISAAFFHATWNLFVKRIDGGPALIFLAALVTAVLYLPVAVYVVVTQQPVISPLVIVFILGSAAIHLAYFLLLQQGYRKGDLSIVYPIARSTGPLLAIGFGVVFLSERMSLQIAVGGLIVILGVLFLANGFRRRASHLTLSLMFGLGVGLLIGSYTAWDAYAVSTLAISPIILDYPSSLFRAAVLTPYAMRRKAQVAAVWREHKVGVLVIGIFSPLAYILVLYVLTFTPVVYVAPTRELSVVISVLFGSLLLGEGDLKRRLGWASVIVVGVALLATG
jgi:drug/metabolite transporter (DMT)-like permease